MSNATLKKGRSKSYFVWDADADLVTVVIAVPEMKEAQKGQMSLAAARQYWHMLKEQGYTQCPSQT